MKDLNFKMKWVIVDEAQLGEELSGEFNMTLKTKKLRMNLKKPYGTEMHSQTTVNDR